MRSSSLARWLTPGLVLAVTTSCTMNPVPRSRLAEGSPASYAELALVDGTRVSMQSPQFVESDGYVHGSIESCAGPSCGAARESRGVPFDKIDTVRIREAHGGLIMLTVIGAFAVGLTIVAASTYKPINLDQSSSSSGGSSSNESPGSSCPRVYSWNGKEFRLDSGTFGGSMVAVTQQTDHDVLEHLVPVGGQYKLRARNELRETEYTDALALRVIDHPQGTQIVPTVDGKLLTFRAPLRPTRAVDLRGRDVLADVAARDGREFRSSLSGRRPDVPADLRDGLALSFPRPAGSKRAKVWITARNSPWSSAMLEYFFAHLGPAYPAFMERLEVDPVARKGFDDFLARDGMLHVRAGATEKLVPLIGPELLKDVALELPADGPGETFELRLDATTAFWNVDAVSVSYDADEPITVHDLAPRSAVTHDGRDVLGQLAKVDGDRFVAETGDYADVVFDAPPQAAGARTALLVSTGYYRPRVASAPDADPAAMVQVMNTPGAAAARSLALLETATARLLLR